jgi:hypothetical protein
MKFMICRAPARHRDAKCVAMVLGIVLAASPLSAAPHKFHPTPEARSILREASVLIPQIDEMQQSSAAANVASLQIRADDLEGAIATAGSLRNENERSLAVSTMAYALVDQGDATLAFRFIADFPRGGDKSTAYVQIALLFIERREFDDALKATRLITRDSTHAPIFVDTLMRIYAARWKSGDRAAAEELLNEAMRVVEHEKKNPVNARFSIDGMYQSIAGRMMEAGNESAAPPVVERIAAMAKHEKDPTQKQFLVRDLAMAQANIGDTSDAVRTIAALPKGSDRDSVLLVIVENLMKHGDKEQALEIANTMSSETMRAIAQRGIASHVAESGNDSGALSVVEATPRQEDRAYGLASLALEQAEKGDPAASNTVELAWQACQSGSGKTRDDALGVIAVTRGILGDFNGALAISQKLNKEERVWPIWNLTEFMVYAGKKQKALEFARSQKVAQAKLFGLLGVARAIVAPQVDPESSPTDSSK